MMVSTDEPHIPTLILISWTSSYTDRIRMFTRLFQIQVTTNVKFDNPIFFIKKYNLLNQKKTQQKQQQQKTTFSLI